MKHEIMWMRLPLGQSFDSAKVISSVNDQVEKDLREQGQTLKNPPAVKRFDEPSPANPINAFYYELDATAVPYLEKWVSDTTGLKIKFSASKENVVDREGFPMVGTSKEDFLRLCDYVKNQNGPAFQQYAQSERYKLIERVMFEGARDPLDGISPKEAGTPLAFLDNTVSPNFQQVFAPDSETIVKKIADGLCAVIKQDYPNILE